MAAEGTAMATLRIASANLEWMNQWFTGDDQAVAWKPFHDGDGGRYVPRDAAARAAGMIRDLNADLVGVEEAPSRPEELRLFIQDLLSDGGQPLYDFVMGDSGGAQKLALLFRPGLQVTRTPSSQLAALLEEWECDVDGDMQLEPYQFTRTPLVADLRLGAELLRIVVLHTKSNFVNRGKELWEEKPQEYVNAALKSRRRISAEAMRLRGYLDGLVGGDPGAKIVVMGDFNDGPGTDYFEKRYLTHNVTDILLGSGFDPEGMFTHAQHDVQPSERFTAVFDDFVERDPDKHLLLDHILLSPALVDGLGVHKVPDSGRVHHGEWAAHTQGTGARRDLRPTDHRPVSVEVEFG